MAGDYNVIPTAADVHNPAAWVTDALFLPQTREKFRALTNLGLTDAIRAVSDDAGLYTFWDYQAGAWQKNWGIRIDHLLLSPQAADRLDHRRHRQARALLGEAVRPRAGLRRSGVSSRPDERRRPRRAAYSPRGLRPSARAGSAPARARRRSPA